MAPLLNAAGRAINQLFTKSEVTPPVLIPMICEYLDVAATSLETGDIDRALKELCVQNAWWWFNLKTRRDLRRLIEIDLAALRATAQQHSGVRAENHLETAKKHVDVPHHHTTNQDTSHAKEHPKGLLDAANVDSTATALDASSRHHDQIADDEHDEMDVDEIPKDNIWREDYAAGEHENEDRGAWNLNENHPATEHGNDDGEEWDLNESCQASKHGSEEEVPELEDDVSDLQDDPFGEDCSLSEGDSAYEDHPATGSESEDEDMALDEDPTDDILDEQDYTDDDAMEVASKRGKKKQPAKTAKVTHQEKMKNKRLLNRVNHPHYVGCLKDDQMIVDLIAHFTQSSPEDHQARLFQVADACLDAAETDRWWLGRLYRLLEIDHPVGCVAFPSFLLWRGKVLTAADVSPKEIVRLMPNEWLSDEIVTRYLKRLTDAFSDVRTVDPTVFKQYLANGSHARFLEKVLRGAKMKTAILVPCCEKNHWNLGWITFNPGKRLLSVRCYDPLGGWTSYGMRVLKALVRAAESLTRDNTSIYYQWSVAGLLLDVPVNCMQKNDSDCGVHILQVASMVARHEFDSGTASFRLRHIADETRNRVRIAATLTSPTGLFALQRGDEAPILAPKQQYTKVLECPLASELPGGCDFRGYREGFYKHIMSCESHLKALYEARVLVCRVSGCPSGFARSIDRANHEKEAHSKQLTIECEAKALLGCESMFVDRKIMLFHSSTMHAKELCAVAPFTCDTCERGYMDEDRFSAHRKTPECLRLRIAARPPLLLDCSFTPPNVASLGLVIRWSSHSGQWSSHSGKLRTRVLGKDQIDTQVATSIGDSIASLFNLGTVEVYIAARELCPSYLVPSLERLDKDHETRLSLGQSRKMSGRMVRTTLDSVDNLTTSVLDILERQTLNRHARLLLFNGIDGFTCHCERFSIFCDHLDAFTFFIVAETAWEGELKTCLTAARSYSEQGHELLWGIFDSKDFVQAFNGQVVDRYDTYVALIQAWKRVQARKDDLSGLRVVRNSGLVRHA